MHRNIYADILNSGNLGNRRACFKLLAESCEDWWESASGMIVYRIQDTLVWYDTLTQSFVSDWTVDAILS